MNLVNKKSIFNGLSQTVENKFEKTGGLNICNADIFIINAQI